MRATDSCSEPVRATSERAPRFKVRARPSLSQHRQLGHDSPSLADMAKLCGFSRMYLSLIERGKPVPPRTARRVAEGYGVKIEEHFEIVEIVGRDENGVELVVVHGPARPVVAG